MTTMTTMAVTTAKKTRQQKDKTTKTILATVIKITRTNIIIMIIINHKH